MIIKYIENGNEAIFQLLERRIHRRCEQSEYSFWAIKALLSPTYGSTDAQFLPLLVPPLL